MSTLRHWLGKLDALSNRERLAVCVGGIAALYLLIGMLGTGPLDTRLRGLHQEIASQREIVSALSGQKAALEARLREHPDTPFQARLAQLDAEVHRVDAEIAGMSSGLVAPQRIPALVRDLLGTSPGVRLKSLRTLAAAPIVEPDESKSTEPESAPAGGLYKHGIEITVEGAYPALVEYASRLEGLPARVVWNRTRIDATAYPRVAMTLTLYTLSLERTWLTL